MFLKDLSGGGGGEGRGRGGEEMGADHLGDVCQTAGAGQWRVLPHKTEDGNGVIWRENFMGLCYQDGFFFFFPKLTECEAGNYSRN